MKILKIILCLLILSILFIVLSISNDLKQFDSCIKNLGKFKEANGFYPDTYSAAFKNPKRIKEYLYTPVNDKQDYTISFINSRNMEFRYCSDKKLDLCSQKSGKHLVGNWFFAEKTK